MEFSIRYYSETTQQPEKHLIPGEAQALDTAGLLLAAVYQDRQNQAGDFSRSTGKRDGRFAFQYGRETGQPEGTGIFFAVDYDAQPGDLTAIKQYFEGVSEGMAEASGKPEYYLRGVYGNGFVCRRLKAAGLVRYTWLSESTGHLESATYQDWNVKQFVTNKNLCNLPAKSWQACESKGGDNGWCFSLNGAVSPVSIEGLAAEQEPVLRRDAEGPAVLSMQQMLNRWLSHESAGHLLEDGEFGPRTEEAVKAFQSSHVDNTGRPLEVDGIAGGLTWGALKRVAGGLPDPSPLSILTPGTSPKWWKNMPDASFGGTPRGLSALAKAVEEAAAGHGETGGNNSGKFVKQYLNGLIDTPANWCAGFVCWCLKESGAMPFKYTVGARKILSNAKTAGLMTFKDPVSTKPVPGDIVVWWRNKPTSWEGHTGYVHHVSGGRIYTIEGNRTSKVEGFDYSLVGMEKLLGIVRL